MHPVPSVPIIPIPTTYNCPIRTIKTQKDIDLETAENNLSTYSEDQFFGEEWKERTSITYKAKELLPCDSFDEKYCQITNETNRRRILDNKISQGMIE